MDVGKLYISLRGRINRKTYWLAMLSLFVPSFFAEMMKYSTDDVMVGLGSIVSTTLIWPYFAVQIKRWHDRSKSGWWCLINLIPIGPIWALIELGFLKGTPCANFYGLPPSSSNKSNDCKSDMNGCEDGFIPEALQDLIAMFAKIAKSDGAISKEEISLIDSFFITILKLTPQMHKSAIRIFEEAVSSTVPYEVYTKRFYNAFKNNQDLLKCVVDFLFALSLIDGEMSAEQEILMSQTLSIFGIEHEAYNQRREQEQQGTTYKSENDKAVYYAQVLGLTENISFDEVRRAYRSLAVQYHPDKVAHLGPKLQKVAHEEMQKINEAYAFFEGKYAVVE